MQLCQIMSISGRVPYLFIIPFSKHHIPPSPRARHLRRAELRHFRAGKPGKTSPKVMKIAGEELDWFARFPWKNAHFLGVWKEHVLKDMEKCKYVCNFIFININIYISIDIYIHYLQLFFLVYHVTN